MWNSIGSRLRNQPRGGPGSSPRSRLGYIPRQTRRNVPGDVLRCRFSFHNAMSPTYLEHIRVNFGNGKPLQRGIVCKENALDNWYICWCDLCIQQIAQRVLGHEINMESLHIISSGGSACRCARLDELLHLALQVLGKNFRVLLKLNIAVQSRLGGLHNVVKE
ncbi:hypothetical protein FR483_n083L [Paramecium bursaria Chlorella virus FR483]|uniref:Uncharacterized protein n083L n=1 Tax=Paramecium bursaria Chlorella virus FR483 TaxID=399781 RepID=A7J6D7_PBCVF|nr:hypothetical protein FR483_n083L [Paramecium bursaria Chlorella virus FR483]ABT15368.1 hypothetical protein FR483_n083L [Paramecium bursaria Chlorella virus FR483]